VTVWQDGTPLWNVENVRAEYDDGDCQWSVNDDSRELTPRTATIYVHDEPISQSPSRSAIRGNTP